MKLLGDENLDMDIVRALMRRLPELDLIMVQHDTCRNLFARG